MERNFTPAGDSYALHNINLGFETDGVILNIDTHILKPRNNADPFDTIGSASFKCYPVLSGKPEYEYGKLSSHEPKADCNKRIGDLCDITKKKCWLLSEEGINALPRLTRELKMMGRGIQVYDHKMKIEAIPKLGLPDDYQMPDLPKETMYNPDAYTCFILGKHYTGRSTRPFNPDEIIKRQKISDRSST